MNVKEFFSPEVSDFMSLNGFEQIPNKGMHDGMIWQKENFAVYFWQNRIEFHFKNQLNDYQLKNTYIGFDGHTMQHLIMILHVMGVISIDSANKLAQQQDSNMKHISNLLSSVPVTNIANNR